MNHLRAHSLATLLLALGSAAVLPAPAHAQTTNLSLEFRVPLESSGGVFPPSPSPAPAPAPSPGPPVALSVESASGAGVWSQTAPSHGEVTMGQVTVNSVAARTFRFFNSGSTALQVYDTQENTYGSPWTVLASN